MDLKSLLDPKTRYIFLTQGEFTHAFPVVHVKEDLLYFSSKKPLPANIDSGHFLAQGNAGIVQFSKPEVMSLQETSKHNLDLILHVIDFSNLDYSITNRRISMRYEFKEFIPITFHVYGEVMTAQLINISEGGLRIRATTPLKNNIVCHFKISLPNDEEKLSFETDGIVVYSEHEKQHDNYMAGISFVVPDFKTDVDKEKYLESKETLRRFVFDKERVL